MEDFRLKRLEKFSGREGPLVFIIMDGIGLGGNDNNNALYLANTPFLDKLQRECPKKKLYTTLKAHGTAVGLPSDEEMGNSEVGHNAFGAGSVPKQRATLAKEAIETKSLFYSKKWIDFTNNIKNNNKKLHFIGLLSDGYVHSHITHLIGLLYGSKDSGIKHVRLHPLLDGRDVPPQSSLEYIEELQGELRKINGAGDYDYRIASGGGRMRVTMDRYNSDWDVVRRGWDAHVCGIPEKFPSYKGFFKSAEEAINKARELDPDISDQYLPSFVVIDEYKTPIGKMDNGDGAIYFNFRGDRAIQISRAFDEENFSEFKKICNPKVKYYGLLQYDEKLSIPNNYFIGPPRIDNTIVDYMHANNINQFAISETHKIGHLTYFWCGNRDLKITSEKVKDNKYELNISRSSLNENYIEVVSERSELIKEHPRMQAYEIRDELNKAIISGKYKFLRVNFANGDMVGHTGSLSAGMIAAETVDECVKEIVDVVNSFEGITIITADHGNLEYMAGDFETAHTLNPVMFAIVDSGYNNEYIINEDIEEPALGNVAATILNLLGYKKPEKYLDSLIKFVNI
ncbi:MAG: 2,3-bisphosphoglycerate-independent phosphoglycerate mutase [Candidatus Hodarchaeota archaeon]